MKLMCRRCGGMTQAQDGTCNNIIGYDMAKRGIPKFCMARDFDEVLFNIEDEDEEISTDCF